MRVQPAKLITEVLVAVYLALVIWQLWRVLTGDDGTGARLQVLNIVVRVMHLVARSTGTIALRAEQAYYRYAATLH